MPISDSLKGYIPALRAFHKLYIIEDLPALYPFVVSCEFINCVAACFHEIFYKILSP